MHRINTIYTPHIHHIYTIHTPHIHHIYTTYTPHIHHIHTIYTPYTHHIHTIYTQCLVNAGVGKNMLDVKQIFNALGGKVHGGADIDLFFETLDPVIVDPKADVSNKKRPTATR